MVNIFEFTDYREYLKAYFAERKKIDPKFSHRWLSQRLDLATSNFIMLVMQGKRNLNPRICFKISRVFKHSRNEASYFENMVNFNQEKNNKDKDFYFSQMSALRKKLKIDNIEEWQYEYYTNWYNPVIRELITSPGYNGDLTILARTLYPAITHAQAKRSIELLLKLGFIKKENGGYVQSSTFIGTQPEINSLAVVNFHRKMGELALLALDRIPKEERNISSSTIFISGKTFDIIRNKIVDFKKDIMELVNSNSEEEKVYHLNVQIFPVSKKLKGNVKK